MTTQEIEYLNNSMTILNNKLMILNSPKYNCLWYLLINRNAEIEELLTSPSLNNRNYNKAIKRHNYYSKQDNKIFKQHKWEGK